jgi:hypothetical protein
MSAAPGNLVADDVREGVGLFRAGAASFSVFSAEVDRSSGAGKAAVGTAVGVCGSAVSVGMASIVFVAVGRASEANSVGVEVVAS